MSIVDYCTCNFDKKELSADNNVRFHLILISRFLQRCVGLQCLDVAVALAGRVCNRL